MPDGFRSITRIAFMSLYGTQVIGERISETSEQTTVDGSSR